MKKLIALSAAAMLVATFAALPMTSDAQVTKSGSKYTLRMKWSKGMKLNYSVTMTPQGVQGASSMQMALAYNVKDVKGGVATIDSRVSMTGQEPMSGTTKVDSRGRVVGESTGGGGTIVELPEKAVAIGDTWKTSGQVPTPMGNLNGSATNKLMGFKKINGKEYAHVQTTMTTKGGFGDGTGKTDSLIDMKDGMMFRSTMGMTFTTKAQGSQKAQKMSFKVDINRR